MTMDRIEVITSVERRRRWSTAEKARLVAAMNEPGAVVTEIARSEGVDAPSVSLATAVCGGARDGGVCPGAGFSRPERGGALGPGGLRAGAVFFDHDRFRRAGSHDDRGRAGLGDFGEGYRRADGAGSVAMIAFANGARVWLATGRTGMRRGVGSLALQVQQGLGRDPHAGDLFVFRGRRGDLVKLIWHEDDGAYLFVNYLTSYCTSFRGNGAS